MTTKHCNLICNCCHKKSISGCINNTDKKIICDNCLKLAPTHFGFMTGKELISYIKKQKNKSWWKRWLKI